MKFPKILYGYRVKFNSLIPEDFIVMLDRKRIIYFPCPIRLTRKLREGLKREVEKNGKSKRKAVKGKQRSH